MLRQITRFRTATLPNWAGKQALVAAGTRQSRYNSTRVEGEPRKLKVPLILGVLGGVGVAGSLFFYHKLKDEAVVTSTSPVIHDYQSVYNDVANLLDGDDAENYDDGSFGPILVRLAWHAAGTYDVISGTGGSNGATMRFPPESEYGANAGLHIARRILEPIHAKHPWISYADLWSLAGACAIQELSGGAVKIPWRPGRVDLDSTYAPPDGRLPDPSKDQSHLRTVFYRMGFNDQEIVALSGAHALGRCHVDRSGFEGPWSFSPTVLTNHYYKHLIEDKWQYRKWNGPKQFQDVATKSLMMLPTDMSLVKDKNFRQYVEKYAADQDLFYEDFGKVFTKLLDLGFTTDTEAIDLKPVATSS